MEAVLTKTEKLPKEQRRRRPNFSYVEWRDLQQAVEQGAAEHVVEFRDISEHYCMEDLVNQYTSYTDEEKRRFRIARTRKGLSTWYWAVLMKAMEQG